MIEYELIKNRYRLYLYKGEKLTLDELSKLPECAVKKSTLSARISNAIRSEKRNFSSEWLTLEQCVTQKIKKGFNKKIIKKKKTITTTKVDFMQVMSLMPVHIPTEI